MKYAVLESIIKLLLLCQRKKNLVSPQLDIVDIESSIDDFNCAEGFVLAQRYMNYMSRWKADLRAFNLRHDSVYSYIPKKSRIQLFY